MKSKPHKLYYLSFKKARHFAGLFICIGKKSRGCAIFMEAASNILWLNFY